MHLIGQEKPITHLLVIQPLGHPQILVPFHDEESAVAAARGAIEKGHLYVAPNKPGERHLFVQGGPGTLFMVMTKADADRATLQAQLAHGVRPNPRG